MLDFPTTINIPELVKSFALDALLEQRDNTDNDELVKAMLDGLIDEVISTLTPIEE
tara:strand:- start:570 stop:737 length:168 start_codon:yes stop_codon:yes gene_type:complete